MKAPTTRTGGFTLLEILIAILIVGIMAAAVIPMIGDKVADAKIAKAIANEAALNSAAQRYLHDHKLPAGYVFNADAPNVPINVDSISQLLVPTDVYGNVEAAPASAVTGSYNRGPYIMPGTLKAASLLAGVAKASSPRPMMLMTSAEYFVSVNNGSASLVWLVSMIPNHPGSATVMGRSPAQNIALSATTGLQGKTGPEAAQELFDAYANSRPSEVLTTLAARGGWDEPVLYLTDIVVHVDPDDPTLDNCGSTISEVISKINGQRDRRFHLKFSNNELNNRLDEKRGNFYDSKNVIKWLIAGIIEGCHGDLVVDNPAPETPGEFRPKTKGVERDNVRLQ